MQITNLEILNLALDTVKNKHESTIDNIRSLDIKSSVILALFGVLLIPSLEILQWIIKINNLYFLKLIPVSITAIGILFCLISLIPQRFKTTPSLSALKNALESNMDVNLIKAQLYSNLYRAIIFNRKVAKRKVIFNAVSIWLSIIVFLLIIILFLLKGVIDGWK
jgi:hypothetical protein